MNPLTRFKPLKKKQGQAYLEVALVIPLLFSLMAAGFQFTHYVTTSNRVASLSRVTADAAFRDCWGNSIKPEKDKGVDKGAAYDACIDPLLKTIYTSANSYITGFDTGGKIVVTVFAKKHSDGDDDEEDDDDKDESEGNSKPDIRCYTIKGAGSGSVSITDGDFAPDSRLDSNSLFDLEGSKELRRMINGKHGREEHEMIVVAEVIQPYSAVSLAGKNYLTFTEIYEFSVY